MLIKFLFCFFSLALFENLLVVVLLFCNGLKGIETILIGRERKKNQYGKGQGRDCEDNK